MNVKFITLSADKFVAYDSKYQGLFVNLQAETTIGDVTYKPGLYFGGNSDWEMLTNSTDPSAVQDLIDAAINKLDGYATISSVSDGVVTLKTSVSETDGMLYDDSDDTDDITLAKVATTGDAADVSADAFSVNADSDSDTYDNWSFSVDSTNIEGQVKELAEKIAAKITSLEAGDIKVNPIVAGASASDLQTVLEAIVQTNSDAIDALDADVVSEDDSDSTDDANVTVEVIQTDGKVERVIVTDNSINATDLQTKIESLDADVVSEDDSDSTDDANVTVRVVETDGKIERVIVTDNSINADDLQTAIEALGGRATIATEKDGVVTLVNSISETDGVLYDDSDDTDNITLAKVATTGAAEDIKFAEYTNSDSTLDIAKDATLQDVMEDVIEAIDALDASSTLKLVNASGTETDTVKADGTTYTLKQGTTDVAKFNIVKDSFVKEGSVVYGTLSEDGKTFTEETAAKDGSNAYIKLVLHTTDGESEESGDVIYIAAASLIEYASVDDSDEYLSEDEDHVISLTEKALADFTKVEGLTVNGQEVAADGTVTIDASDILYSEGTSAGDSDDITVAAAIKALEDGAYAGVLNDDDSDEPSYVTISDIDANNQQKLEVTYGSFTVEEVKDADGNVTTAAKAQVPGLATVEDVEKVITDNEKVTAESLNDLDERVSTLEAIDPVTTTVEGSDGSDSGNKSGVNVTVTNAKDSDNDYDYTVSADLVWLTELPA